MIARVWHGRVRWDVADDYSSYLLRTGIPDYQATPGNRGVYVLRQERGREAHFLLISLWDSMDAIRGFAGANVRYARYYPEDDRYLLEMEPTVSHYVVQVAPEQR